MRSLRSASCAGVGGEIDDEDADGTAVLAASSGGGVDGDDDCDCSCCETHSVRRRAATREGVLIIDGRRFGVQVDGEVEPWACSSGSCRRACSGAGHRKAGERVDMARMWVRGLESEERGGEDRITGILQPR